ncbi:hypothetical protein FisN_4Lh035 [Fistulifera solaris]|uniref:SBF1/SBF2 domain-containing protein n=1 Tax=Fistulifera solaris TaxID=1519565 RepID=A0A1Z5KDQ8_FISSO|nr:hypothetical protein FisN_4Lh035 [Fistulifera solaris]|eukprot:GAX24262.1 hypothetical protein FisN_4Lh035 [Fistulifera solaris]
MIRALKRQFSKENSGGKVDKDDNGELVLSTEQSPAPNSPKARFNEKKAPKKRWTNADNKKMAGLATFDACVHAADALGAASGLRKENTVLAARKDPQSGLMDCSVLVSPDGDLLLVNSQTVASQWKKTGNRMEGVSENNGEDVNPERDEDALTLFSQLIAQGKEDYESAIFLGNDLQKDQHFNGFSAKGWSIPATSHALYQTEQSMQHLGSFCHDVLTASKQQICADVSKLCQRWRQTHPSVVTSNGTGSAWYSGRGRTVSSDWELLDPRAVDFEETTERVGPLLSPSTSTVYQAIQALEQYHLSMAEADLQRLQKASAATDHGKLRNSFSAVTQSDSSYEGFLTAYRAAMDKTAQRVAGRQQALTEILKRVRIMEERVSQLKQNADRCWENVYNAELKCQKKMEQALKQRSMDRQRLRLDKLKKQKDGQSAAILGTTSEEISDIAKGVADMMEDGSFEPMDLPSAPFSLPQDQATFNGDEGDDEFNDQLVGPTASREQIEHYVGLPDLRKTALQADEDIEDAARDLLNLLSTLDTTRRSARTAAEACLLAAGNAQARCLKFWIELERASLEDRLTSLAAVEESIDAIDVRRDLDFYIEADKRSPGGSSHLGDDDDGGVASALATLSSHVEAMTGGSHQESSKRVDGTSTDQAPSVIPEMNEAVFESSIEKINDSIQKLFATTSELQQDLLMNDDTARIRDEFDSTVSFLCQTAHQGKSSRSALCYALNLKRSDNAHVLTKLQFDGLCEIFSAILTGCANEEGGISNAKICIMLTQTFYMIESDSCEHSLDVSISRSERIYIRNKLLGHPIWSKDEFWDEALNQQIDEAMTQSGVMANFEKQKISRARQIRQNSEWGQVRKTKWHDLNSVERVEAASQVHAIVFAQLGSLAHSMMEFGCGLERASAFVRRSSIRNQLPSNHRTMLLQHLLEAQRKLLQDQADK